MNKFINSEDSDEAGHNDNESPVLFYAVCHLVYTMTQMAHFSFPYYFTIPNSEFWIPKFALRIPEFGIVNYI